MKDFSRKFEISVLAAVLLCALLSGCGRKKQDPSAMYGSAEPDKVLFDRAMEDLKKSRYTVARLTLQTLINTYPDSEYLAKAKLAVADSYYKEGGTSGLTQAVAEYKDFITFFPFLEEAVYAQMQTAMSHYRRMEKPDRDRTQAKLAEQELQTFLLKYPDHPRGAEAEQRLREVQEVLAEGEFRVARYYYIKGSLRAAGGRLLELVDRYPLYSQADQALWMLGDAYERVERGDVAAGFYSRIVRDYPLSERVEDARKKLVQLAVPVPQPNPDALARMQKEQESARQRPGMLRSSLGLFKSGPDVSAAARIGKPNLSPPSESSPGSEVLTAGGASGTSGSTVVVEAGPSSAPSKAAPPEAGAAAPEKPAESAGKPAAQLPTRVDPKNPAKKKEDDKKKPEEKKPPKEKKGLRKIIPW